LVVIRTTPLDARDPKMAAAEASFRISMLSISSGFRSLMASMFWPPNPPRLE